MSCQTTSRWINSLVIMTIAIPNVLALFYEMHSHSLLQYATPIAADQFAEIQRVESMQLIIAGAALVSLAAFATWAVVRLMRVRGVDSSTVQGLNSIPKPRPVLLGIAIATSIVLAGVNILALSTLAPILKWFKPIGDEQILAHASAQGLSPMAFRWFSIWCIVLVGVCIQEFRRFRRERRSEPLVSVDSAASLPG